MKLFVLIVAALCVANGEDARKYASQTTSPFGSRFEIVQSPIVARDTFKLDKLTGQVWQLVKNATDDLSWEPMHIGRPSPISDTAPHFQIFLSGIARRNSFLLDTSSGRVWLLSEATVAPKDGQQGFTFSTWEPVSDDPPFNPASSTAK